MVVNQSGEILSVANQRSKHTGQVLGYVIGNCVDAADDGSEWSSFLVCLSESIDTWNGFPGDPVGYIMACQWLCPLPFTF